MSFRKSHKCNSVVVPKKQTEAEILSMDAGLRQEGIPTLSFCDIFIDVLEALAPGRPVDKKIATARMQGQVSHQRQ